MGGFFPTMKRWLLVLLSFLGGVILMILQLPTWLGWFCVPWLVLILFYWILMLPQQVNLGAAWLLGIFLDIVYNVPLGENALALVLIAYFVIKFRDSVILLDFWQIAVVVFVLMVIYQLLRFMMQVFCGYYFDGWSILSCAIISALVWPFLAQGLLIYQLKYRI